MTLSVMLLVVPLLIPSQQPIQGSAESEMRELINLVVNDAMIAEVMQQATDVAYTMVRQGLQSRLKHEVNAAEEEKLRAAIHRAMSETVPKNLWQDAFIPIYMRAFTHAEVVELLKFYKTRLGRKLLEVTPKLTHDGAQAGKELFEAHTDEFLSRFIEAIGKSFIEEISK